MPVNSPRLALRSPSLADAADASVFGSNLTSDLDALLTRLQFFNSTPGIPYNSHALHASMLKVSQRAAGGANMSVDVQAGMCLIQETPDTFGALTPVFEPVLQNIVVPAAHGTLPRIDQVIETADGDTFVVPGTATAGATLSNNNGAVSDATLNATYAMGWIRLASVLVPAASVTVIDANIWDRRRRSNGKLYAELARDAAFPSLANGTQTLINLDGAYYQNDVIWSVANPSRLYLPRLGQYMLDWVMDMPVNIPDWAVDLQFRKEAAGVAAGGSTATYSSFGVGTNNAGGNFRLVALYDNVGVSALGAATNYIEPFINQVSGAARTPAWINLKVRELGLAGGG